MAQTAHTAELADRTTLLALAEHELKRSGFRLQFPQVLEEQFHTDTAAARVADLRVITRIGIGSYLAVGFLIDLVLLHNSNWPAAIAQAAAVLVATAVGFRLMRREISFRRREGAFFVICLTCTLSAIFAIGAEASPIMLRDLIFGIVPLNVALVFARLYFPYAVLLCLVSGAAFAVLVATCTHLAPGDHTLLLGLLLILSVPSLFGLHWLERAARRLYLLEFIQRLNYERAVAANAVLTNLSFTDALTGIANRRRLDAALQDLIRHPATQGALLLVDIDFFKRFNDAYGHATGDDCLRHVAACLAGALEDGDLVARLGGEEFAILLPHCSVPAAMVRAETLRLAVERLPYSVGGHQVAVTVSIGVATAPAHNDAEALYAAADEALYRSKSLGRNRVSGPRPWIAPRPGSPQLAKG